ncbi:MAG: succinylglutamate desuccinylase/aspartoacylase family protein [Verrucomicrobiota bacterium]
MAGGKKIIKREPLVLGGQSFAPGTSGTLELTVGHMIDHQPLSMTVHVARGRQAGPCLMVSAGIHGNEICGVESLRLLLKMRLLKRLRGDLIVVPVVNMPAFMARSRYLPDRRDLNRLFPGSAKGSLGGRLASLFVEEVVGKCTHAVDMHSGAVNRPNLPQIRISPDDEAAMEMAKAFRVPVVIESPVREGTLRQTLLAREIPSLLFEAGEAGRLDHSSVRYGVRGLVSVMRSLSMLPQERKVDTRRRTKTVVADETYWERAPMGGIFTPMKELGKAVTVGEVLGIVADPFGRGECKVKARESGVIIGCSRDAAVDEGDALFHIALTHDPAKAERQIQRSSRFIKNSLERHYTG